MPIEEKIRDGVYLIAEMSANHAGKLENALEIVRAAKKAGADCVKIQTYTPDTMTIDCSNEYFRITGGLWNGDRLYDLYGKAQTPLEWHSEIQRVCRQEGIDFLSTPFDKSAVDFLEDLGVAFYKIASFELVDIPLIEYTAAKGKPMLLSCGLAQPEEIAEAVDACRRQGNDKIILLKCCSEYPASYRDMNLSVIADMKERFGLPVGLSDHSLGSLAAVVGVTLGACVVEKHFCLSRNLETPDSQFSMEPEEFAVLAGDIRSAAEIMGKTTYTLTEEEKKSLKYRRSIFAVADIRQGDCFTEQNIRVIRPGDGMKPKYYGYLLGRTAGKSYLKGDPLDGEYETI